MGDPTASFALGTFFPEKIQQVIEQVCSAAWSLFNACGCIGALQRCLIPRPKADPKKEEEKTKEGEEEEETDLEAAQQK